MPINENYTYYPYDSITIFPSSNAVDGGKLFSEKNGRNITKNITELNYVVSPRPNGFNIEYTDSKLIIKSGKAIINGFEIDALSDIEYKLPTTDKIINNENSKYNGYAMLCLFTIFDSNNNIVGDFVDATGKLTYCGGIGIAYVTEEEYQNNLENYLLLGGVNTEGNIKISDEKFARLDVANLLVKIDSDSETGVPPEQHTDLSFFLNNILHSYWVSKAGDNVYSSLTFRDMPAGYKEAGFDTKNEPLLTNSNYYIKLDKQNNSGYIQLNNFNNNTNVNIDSSTILFNNEAKLYYENKTVKTLSDNFSFSNNNGYTLQTTNNGIETRYLTNVTRLLDSHGDLSNISPQGIIRVSSNDLKIEIKNSTNTGYIALNNNNNNCINISNIETPNNVYAHGYIVAGEAGVDPSTITVPDYFNTGGERKIKSGDIVTKNGQVWSAVYNDIAEVFDIKGSVEPGQVIAIDLEGNYKVANRKLHNNIIGVVSENPAFCCGSNGNIPIALAGRVNVQYIGKTPNYGDAVCLSKVPGKVKKGNRHSKYFVGIVTKIIDNNFVEILVK